MQVLINDNDSKIMFLALFMNLLYQQVETIKEMCVIFSTVV